MTDATRLTNPDAGGGRYCLYLTVEFDQPIRENSARKDAEELLARDVSRFLKENTDDANAWGWGRARVEGVYVTPTDES